MPLTLDQWKRKLGCEDGCKYPQACACEVLCVPPWDVQEHQVGDAAGLMWDYEAPFVAEGE